VTALAWAGSVAMGVVWGWWTAPQSERRPRSLAGALVVVAGTVQTAQIVSFSGYAAAAGLVGGWIVGFSLHQAFRTALRLRLRERTTS